MNIVFQSKDELGTYFLKRDVVWNYIPKDQIQELIDFAWKKGARVAEEQKRIFGPEGQDLHTISEILENQHVVIKRREQGPQQIFSEFYQNKKLVILNTNCIRANFLNKNKELLIPDAEAAVTDVFLAHEFFHFLECFDKQVGVTFKEKKICTRRILGYEYKVGIRMLSEIAAHSFSRHFVDFSKFLRVAFDPETGISCKLEEV